MNKKTKCEKLANFLISEINKIDFSILKENYNRLFERQLHTKIIYEDDDYSDIPFFDKRFEGDDVFLENELVKQINLSLDEINHTKFSETKKFDLLWDKFNILIQAIAISLGSDPISYEKRVKVKMNDY